MLFILGLKYKPLKYTHIKTNMANKNISTKKKRGIMGFLGILKALGWNKKEKAMKNLRNSLNKN